MIDPRRIGVIVRKELVDAARDRRTMMMSVLSSVLMGPLLLVLLLNFIGSQAQRARDITLPVEGRELAPAVMAFLEAQQVKLVPAPADYEARVRRGDLDAVLVVDPAFMHDVERGRPGVLRLVHDRSRERAQSTVNRVENLLDGYGRLWGAERLMLRGVAPSVAAPMTVESVDLATPQQEGALMLFLVAYYAGFAGIIGAMAPSLDTSAGERERQSLEPLLMTPARPADIVVGKWLAVCAFAGAAVGLTVLLYHVMLTYVPLPAVGVPFLFGWRELGRMLIVLVPLVLLYPALLLWLAARGRTVKEAQASVSLVMAAAAMLPLVNQFMNFREPPWLPAVPVSGQFALMRLALRGEALPLGELALSYVGPLAITALALAAVTRLFARESVLAGR